MNKILLLILLYCSLFLNAQDKKYSSYIQWFNSLGKSENGIWKFKKDIDSNLYKNQDLEYYYYSKIFDSSFDKNGNEAILWHFWDKGEDTLNSIHLDNMINWYRLIINKYYYLPNIENTLIEKDFYEIPFEIFQKDIYEKFIKNKQINQYSLLFIGKFKIKSMYDTLLYYAKNEDKILKKSAYMGLVRVGLIEYDSIPNHIEEEYYLDNTYKNQKTHDPRKILFTNSDIHYCRSEKKLQDLQEKIIRDTISIIGNCGILYPPRYFMLVDLGKYFYNMPKEFSKEFIEYLDKKKNPNFSFKKIITTQ